MSGSVFVCLVVIALWGVIGLFCLQYRDCRALKRRERLLERKNAEMTFFVYGAAHDLKAPLRAIMQANDRLHEYLKDKIGPAQEEDFMLLRQRAQRMTTLIDDLLAYWQAGQETAHTHNEMIDMESLVRDVVAFIAPPSGFSVITDMRLKDIRLCHMPMRQILMNLIGNALKHHGGVEGIITVSVVDEGRTYRFCIADNGRGVPDEHKKRIFEPFETLRPRDEVEGSGLGLSLVKRILDRQGCEIYARDAAAGGVEFYFTWPKAPRG